MELKLQAAEKAEILGRAELLEQVKALEQAEALEQVELLKQAEALGQAEALERVEALERAAELLERAELLKQAAALGQAELKLPKLEISLHLQEHIEAIVEKDYLYKDISIVYYYDSSTLEITFKKDGYVKDCLFKGKKISE